VSRARIPATRRLTLIANNRTRPVGVVGPADFEWEPGAEIEPETVIRDPALSLYCFDRESGSALFVEVDDPAAVEQAPFYYQGQNEHARGLVSMPLEVFHRLAETIAEPPGGLIFIHSVGRCGSTLVSKALEAVPEVQSLSEPDDLTQMIEFRTTGGAPDAELRRLIRSTVRWRCKPRSGAPARWVAIKMRSEVMVLADLIGLEFPAARHLFLYRDGVSWMRSVYQNAPPERNPYDEVANRELEASWAYTIPLVRDSIRADAAMNPAELRILAWVTCMEAYLGLRETGIPLCAARFEDLTANPVPVLEQLFTFCGIEGADWDSVREVLGRDSQAGTVFDREKRRKARRELPEALAEDARRVIAGRPRLRAPDVIVPGTILEVCPPSGGTHVRGLSPLRGD